MNDFTPDEGWGQIRPVAEKDLADLARLYTHYALNTVYTYFDRPAGEGYMRSLLCEKGHYCAVAIAPDGLLMGYVHISPGFGIYGKRGEVAIYLFPEYTGKGMGKRLLRHGEDWCRAQGLHTLAASVCTENRPSLRLFSSGDYTPTSLRHNAATKFGRSLHTQSFIKKL